MAGAPCHPRLCFALIAGLLSASGSAQEAPANPLGGAAPEEVPRDQKEKIWKASPEKPRVPPRKPRKVLIFVTPEHLMKGDPHRGYCLPYCNYALKALGEKTKAFEPVISNDQFLLHPRNLKEFDAVVLQNTCGNWTTPGDAALEKFRAQAGDRNLTAAAVEKILRQGFLDYVREGRGVVGIHFAIGGHRQWEEYYDMWGAKSAGHPWNKEIGIKVDEPGHPLVAAFGGASFRLADEIYVFTDPYSRRTVRTLLSIDTRATDMQTKETLPASRKDSDFALAWVRNYGKGRLFYTTFGHRTELFWHPQLLQFYLDGLQFAAGDLEAPAAPKEETR